MEEMFDEDDDIISLFDELLSSTPQKTSGTLETVSQLPTMQPQSHSKFWHIVAGAIIIVPHLIFLPSLPSVLLRRGAPFVRTKRKCLAAAFDALETHVPLRGKSFVDLGSGDGTAVIAAAERGFATAKGYEINPFLCIYSCIKSAVVLGPRHFNKTSFSFGSFWPKTISGDVVFVYGLEPIMQRLGEKLENELAPGSYVVSNVFEFPKWKPLLISDSIFIYRTPNKT